MGLTSSVCTNGVNPEIEEKVPSTALSIKITQGRFLLSYSIAFYFGRAADPIAIGWHTKNNIARSAYVIVESYA